MRKESELHLEESKMKITRVSMIAPNPTVPLGTNGNYLVMLLWGLPLLGTILKQHGYEVRIFFEIVKPIHWEFVYSSQVVCFQLRACTAHRTFEFIKRIKAHNKRAITVIGGTVPTCLPEEMLQHCDFVGRQEGDETLPDLLNALQTGRDLRQVPGISYKINENQVVHNPNRPLAQDIDVIPDLSLIDGWREIKRWRLLLRKRVLAHVVQTSRGCPHKCSFCIVSKMYNPGTYRVRSIDSVVEEIKGKIADTGCRRFIFTDNCFGARRAHTKALLRRIIDEDIKFSCLAMCRLDIYKDPELLSLLKQAGFGPIYIGFESFNDSALKDLHKRQTVDHIVKAIAVIKEYDIRISGSFIIGSDEETVDSIHATIDNAMRYDIDYITVFPFSAMPGYAPLPELRRRRIVLDYDFFSGNHVMVFPKQMKPSTLQKEYIRACRICNNFKISWQKLIKRKIGASVERFLAYLSYRGVIEDIETRYLPLLYQVEQGLYDEQERLLEHKLPPYGVLGEGFITRPVEKTSPDPWLQQDQTVKNSDIENHCPLTVGEGIDSTTMTDLVRAHTLEMALRKC